MDVLLANPRGFCAGVDIKEFGLFEQRLGLALRVVNPNDTEPSRSNNVFSAPMQKAAKHKPNSNISWSANNGARNSKADMTVKISD